MAVNELHENYRWLAAHGAELSKFAGKWIAVARNRVVAVSDSLKALMANPAVRRETEPLVTKVPMPEEGIAAL